MSRPLMPCTRCGGPRRLETFQSAELEACTQCGAVTLTRSDLLSLSGHASPIPAGGLLGLVNRRSHPTLMPEDEVLDELRTSPVSSIAPTDEFAFLPQKGGPPELSEELKAEITYTPLPEHPAPAPAPVESSVTEHAPNRLPLRPSQVPTLVPDSYDDDDLQVDEPSLHEPTAEEPPAQEPPAQDPPAPEPSRDALPGRPPEPVGVQNDSLGDSFDNDFFSDEVDKNEPEWELPPPTDESSANEPGLSLETMFDNFAPTTDEVPTTVDRSWLDQDPAPVEPETVQSPSDVGSLSMRDEFQPERVDPSISDYGQEKRRRNRMMLVLAIAIVFFVGVPLIAFATLTVLQNQENERRAAAAAPVPGQTMADALTPDPVEPEPPEGTSTEPGSASTEPAAPKSEVSVETPSAAKPTPTPTAAPPPAAKPKPKPKPRTASQNTVSAGWNKVNSDPSAAAVIFQSVLNDSPRNADARYGLGYAMLQSGNTKGALTHLCQARSLGGVEIEREVTGLLSTKGLSCP